MADYAITITEDDVLGAETYLPLSIKEQVARSMAVILAEPVEINTSGEDALPLMVRENRKLRQQFQMGVLASKLHREFNPQMVRIRTKNGELEEQPLVWVMDEEDYDRWASSHVMNQLERMKKSRNATVVNKLFDLLYDCKSIELMLSGAIHDELEQQNDLFNRAMEYFTVSASQAALNTLMGDEIKSALENRKVDAE